MAGNRERPKGRCEYCGMVTTAGAMGKHLAACAGRRAAIAQAEESGRPPETVYQLRVRDEYDATFWLDLEMRGSAPLEKLDGYLRAIWLECCGHLSRFTSGGWGTGEIGKRRTADQVFRGGATVTHMYDFGTTSYTRIRAAGTRTGAPVTTKPIALLARNLVPTVPCMKCGEPATHMCQGCRMEDDTSGFLCEPHAKRHRSHREDYGEPVEIANSPRVGLCGYTGPADPPY